MKTVMFLLLVTLLPDLVAAQGVGVPNIIGGTTDVAATTSYTPNAEIADAVSGPVVMNLAPGNYSFKVVLGPSTYGNATVYARQGEGILTWQIFPD